MSATAPTQTDTYDVTGRFRNLETGEIVTVEEEEDGGLSLPPGRYGRIKLAHPRGGRESQVNGVTVSGSVEEP